MIRISDSLFIFIISAEVLAGLVFFVDLFVFDMNSGYLELFLFCALVFFVVATPIKIILVVTNFIRMRHVWSSVVAFFLSFTNFTSLWAVAFIVSMVSGLGFEYNMMIVENLQTANLLKILYFFAFVVLSGLFWYFFLKENRKFSDQSGNQSPITVIV